MFLPFLFIIPMLALSQNPYAVSSKTKKEEQKPDTRSAFAKEFDYLPMVDWKKGMRFMAVRGQFNDKKFSLIRYDRDVIVAPKLTIDDFEGKIFVFDRVEDRQFIYSGKLESTWGCVVFRLDTSLFEFVYHKGSIEQLRVLDAELIIPDLVWVDEIDEVRERLVGQKIFLLTDQWFRDEADREVRVDGQKYISAKVTNVGYGSQRCPIKIVFQTTDGNESHISVSISHVNGMMHVNNRLTKDFDSVFSLTDPKKNHPNISTSTWALIQSGKVKVGMTKQECRLSWGEPLDINSTASGASIKEQWVYGSSSYLYFTNNRLTSIQN